MYLNGNPEPGARSQEPAPRDRDFAVLAVSMRSKRTLALTPALSPRRGSTICPCCNESPPSETSRNLQKLLPLPGGEGQGEGEHHPPPLILSVMLLLILSPGCNKSTPQEQPPAPSSTIHHPSSSALAARIHWLGKK